VASSAVDRWSAPAAEGRREIALGSRDRAQVFADPGDLGHVVDNLVENALRYSPPGTRVTIETAASDGRATLVIADDGPGIPTEERTRVFERFYRGSTGRRAGPGTGLGLAIVAELVGRWGGEVRLLDGPGTRIAATFERAPAER
jgi:signal transduction histidine kinase